MATGKKAGKFGPGKTSKDDYHAFDPSSVSGGGAVNRPKPASKIKVPTRRPARGRKK